MKLFNQMLTSLRNGQVARKLVIQLPYSKFCWNVLTVFLFHGYIKGMQKQNQFIFIILKYVNDKPAIQKLEQISTSSQKVYSSYAQLNVPNQGLGLVLLSTSKGILSSSKALELKVGGEVLCKIF